MARSAQTNTSISFIWIVWSTLYVYFCPSHQFLSSSVSPSFFLHSMFKLNLSMLNHFISIFQAFTKMRMQFKMFLPMSTFLFNQVSNFIMNLLCHRFSKKTNEKFQGFLPQPLKRGWIKKMKALFITNQGLLNICNCIVKFFDLNSF